MPQQVTDTNIADASLYDDGCTTNIPVVETNIVINSDALDNNLTIYAYFTPKTRH